MCVESTSKWHTWGKKGSSQVAIWYLAGGDLSKFYPEFLGLSAYLMGFQHKYAGERKWFISFSFVFLQIPNCCEQF